LKHLDFKSKIRQEYAFLNDMIRQTSEMLVGLVRTQGTAMSLQYARKIMYLCLIRKNDGKGRCCGVRWAKYQYSFKTGRRSWYNFKLPGKVPASTLKLMSPDDKNRFQELDALASKILDLRHDLTSKKMRILTTFRHIRDTDEPRLKQILKDYQVLKQGAGSEINAQETESGGGRHDAAPAAEVQGYELIRTAQDSMAGIGSPGAESEESLPAAGSGDNLPEAQPAKNLEDLDLSKLSDDYSIYF